MSVGTPAHAKGMLESAQKSNHFWAQAYIQEVVPLLGLLAAQAAQIAALETEVKELRTCAQTVLPVIDATEYWVESWLQNDPTHPHGTCVSEACTLCRALRALTTLKSSRP